MAVDRTREEVAVVIENFLDGTCGDWDWDDFVSVTIRDPDLDEIRQQCCAVREKFPAGSRGGYCNEDGLKLLRSLAGRLRATV